LQAEQIVDHLWVYAAFQNVEELFFFLLRNQLLDIAGALLDRQVFFNLLISQKMCSQDLLDQGLLSKTKV